MKMLPSLAYVPEHDVIDSFVLLMASFPESKEMSKLRNVQRQIVWATKCLNDNVSAFRIYIFYLIVLLILITLLNIKNLYFYLCQLLAYKNSINYSGIIILNHYLLSIWV